MKLTLLSVNASWTHSCLALYYLRNAIADLDYRTEIIELTLKQNLQEALEAVHNSAPDVLCLSVYIWNVEYIRQLVPDIRKLLPDLIIVAGGPEITFNARTADCLNPDILISGYGEQAFRELAEQRFKSTEKVLPGAVTPLEQIPFPYNEADRDSLRGRMVYYEASRGCACRCIYCLSSREEKQDWLPSARVFSDIDRLLSLQPKVIKFVDRSFNQKKQWARDIWQYVIALETNVPFHFEIHPDWLEERDIAILGTAPPGRIQFEIGIQSIHPQTLNKIDRPSDWSVVCENLLSLSQRTNIPLHTDLIVGLPGENLSMVAASVNAVLPTFPAELQLGFLKILAGTLMAETAASMDYVWSETAPYTVLKTPDLPFSEILHLDKLSRIISQFWNKGDFTTVWRKAVQERAPFQCMEELLALTIETEGELHPLDRIKRFDLLALWIDRNWDGDSRQYLSDALKWDWCRKSGEAWYPPALKGETALQFRKDHYTEILDWLKHEFWQNEDWILKRFTVFSASSEAFCRNYLDGYTKAIFISRKAGENAVEIYYLF